VSDQTTTEFVRVPLPQLGANDPSAQILEWLAGEGAHVRAGEPICRVETTKSVSDVEAPTAGYLVPLITPGSDAETGAVIAVLASEPVSAERARTWLAEAAWRERQHVAQGQTTAAAGASREGNWTYKAELLARQHGLDIATVPQPATGKITEALVRAHLDQMRQAPKPTAAHGPHSTHGAHAEPESARRAGEDTLDDRYPANKQQRLLLIGGGYGAVQVLDIVHNTPGQRVVAIMDDNPTLVGRRVGGVPVIGGVSAEKAAELFQAGEFDAALCTVSTSIPFRERVFNEWRARGIPFANVIHPSAVIGTNVALGQGNIILALCKVGAAARVGDNNVLSSYCSIEHHCILDNHCSFGPAVITSSGVHIHDRVLCGTGIFIEPFIEIGADSVVGSGCAIWSHIPERSIVKTKPNYVVRRRE
jgi:sugar O-acyltransferase (sialic acid O-acetyltransferase NeuD family)